MPADFLEDDAGTGSKVKASAGKGDGGEKSGGAKIWEGLGDVISGIDNRWLIFILNILGYLGFFFTVWGFFEKGFWVSILLTLTLVLATLRPWKSEPTTTQPAPAKIKLPTT